MDIPELERTLSAFEQDVALLDDMSELRGQLVRLASEYLLARVDWACRETAERALVDIGRTRAHDAFISAFDAFTRKAALHGSSLEWRRRLGSDGEIEERKRIGDFACYLAFRVAIDAR